MNVWTWRTCCEKAVKEMKVVGMCHVNNYRSVMSWNIEYRYDSHFQHPNASDNSTKKSQPPLFQLFPQAKKKLLTFCSENSSDMSIDMTHKYLTTHIIPKLLEKEETEKEDAVSSHTSVHRYMPIPTSLLSPEHLHIPMFPSMSSPIIPHALTWPVLHSAPGKPCAYIGYLVRVPPLQ